MKLTKPKISNRMKVFLEHSLPDLPFWDICCDHGYVGLAALHSRVFTEVHFVDQLPHIMERLSILLTERARSDDLKFFLHSAGGQDINQTVRGNCLIAGVGGLTITVILNGLLKNNKLDANRLLLSPHTDEKTLVAFVESPLFFERYNFTEKIIISERGRLRPLYIFDRKQSASLLMNS